MLGLEIVASPAFEFVPGFFREGQFIDSERYTEDGIVLLINLGDCGLFLGQYEWLLYNPDVFSFRRVPLNG